MYVHTSLDLQLKFIYIEIENTRASQLHFLLLKIHFVTGDFCSVLIMLELFANVSNCINRLFLFNLVNDVQIQEKVKKEIKHLEMCCSQVFKIYKAGLCRDPLFDYGFQEVDAKVLLQVFTCFSQVSKSKNTDDPLVKIFLGEIEHIVACCSTIVSICGDDQTPQGQIYSTSR
jgi:hypothetical protein